jgi:F0F1-type ATP synthase assembly protein I
MVVTLLATLFGVGYALSALVGGGIALSISAVFSSGVFVAYRADQPQRLLGHLYRAQFRKLILGGLLFGAAFGWLHPPSPGTLIGVFFIVYLLSPLRAHKSGKTL